MIASRRLGILGGTFDPIHFGHLDAADAARRALSLDQVCLIPSCDPPHRPADPLATVFQRFALVALAIQDDDALRASDAELTRIGPSYTADTLRAFARQGWQPSQLFFILGSDAFAEIATWREYPAVLDAAHFVVIARPGTTLDAAAARTPAVRSRMRAAPEHASGGTGTSIFLVEARTRNISSSTIRSRLAARQPIDDLVPTAVARHIVAHHLYEAVDNLHGQDSAITQ
jgi:nicotinate-nucleotide adenylyltransferase